MNTGTPIISLAVYLKGGKVTNVASNSSQPVRVAIVNADEQESNGHIQPVANQPEEVAAVFESIGDLQQVNHQPKSLLDEANQLLCQVNDFAQTINNRMPQLDYIANKGCRCPVCGNSEDVDLKSAIQADGGIATSEVECAHCGAEWTDTYQLTGYGYLVKPVINVIVSESEIGYWSNDLGWVPSLNMATRFYGPAKPNLPVSKNSDANCITIESAMGDFLETPLSPGDDVYWNHPEIPLRSGIYTLHKVIKRQMAIYKDDIVQILDVMGDTTEVYAHELHINL